MLAGVQRPVLRAAGFADFGGAHGLELVRPSASSRPSGHVDVQLQLCSMLLKTLCALNAQQTPFMICLQADRGRAGPCLQPRSPVAAA